MCARQEKECGVDEPGVERVHSDVLDLLNISIIFFLDSTEIGSRTNGNPVKCKWEFCGHFYASVADDSSCTRRRMQIFAQSDTL